MRCLRPSIWIRAKNRLAVSHPDLRLGDSVSHCDRDRQIVATILCAPLIQKLLGLPAFPLRIRVSSGAITFTLLVPALWIALSPRSDVTRRMALIALAIILVLFALLLWWLHPWSLLT